MEHEANGDSAPMLAARCSALTSLASDKARSALRAIGDGALSAAAEDARTAFRLSSGSLAIARQIKLRPPPSDDPGAAAAWAEDASERAAAMAAEAGAEARCALAAAGRAAAERGLWRR